jgi:hypothetical protein
LFLLLGLSESLACETMPRFALSLAALSLWLLTAHAQFGFFDQMFGGQQQQQQQQQQQNVRSDSAWYQTQYENGKFSLFSLRIPSSSFSSTHKLTTLKQLPARTTFAPARSRASRSRTTVPARGRRQRTRLSLGKE